MENLRSADFHHVLLEDANLSWIESFINENNRLLSIFEKSFFGGDWNSIKTLPHQFSILIKQLEEREISANSLEIQIGLLYNLAVIHSILGQTDETIFLLEILVHREYALGKVLFPQKTSTSNLISSSPSPFQIKNLNSSFSNNNSSPFQTKNFNSSFSTNSSTDQTIIETLRGIDIFSLENATIFIQSLWLLSSAWLINGSRERAFLILDKLRQLPKDSFFFLSSNSEDSLMNHITFYLLALLALSQDELKEARLSIEQCLSINDHFFPGIFLQAQIDYLQQNYPKSLEGFQICANMQKYRATDALAYRGCIYHHQNEHWVAIHEFSQAISIEVLPELIFNLGFEYGILQKLDAKQKMFEFALQTIQKGYQSKFNPSSFRIDFQKKVKNSNVIFPFVKMIAEETSLVPLSQPNVSLIDALYQLAVVSIQKKQFAYAAAAFREIIQTIKHKSNQTTVSLPVPSFLLFRQFLSTLIRAQAYDEAKQVCNHLLSSDPLDVLTMIELTDIYVCTDTDLEDGEKILRKGYDVLIKSQDSELKTHFSGSFDDEEIEDVVEPNPKRIKFSKNVKISLFKSFKYGKTKITRQSHNQYFFHPVQRKELKIRLLNNLAMIQICLNKLPEALKTLQVAHELSPNKIEVVYNYVLLKFQCEQVNEAIKLWMDFRNISMNQNLSSCDLLISDRQSFLTKSFQPIECHVLGNVSNYQLYSLDLHVLLHWRNILEQKAQSELFSTS